MSGGIGCVLGSVAVPIVSVICGLILWKATPPINAFFGYRSKLSQQNELLWGFAQKTAGRLLVAVCVPMTLVSLSVGIIADKNFSADGKYWTLIVLVAFQTAVMALINLQIESKLRSALDENGEPRG
ncbi:MAG: SdpI family protein [Oscillospiraceae bacterium]|nr:SdpI family protein [Oscillospiraceae bacterium]